MTVILRSTSNKLNKNHLDKITSNNTELSRPMTHKLFSNNYHLNNTNNKIILPPPQPLLKFLSLAIYNICKTLPLIIINYNSK